jgi:nitrate/TMAO reductase-like tetraheme cytochrome c subunit
MRKLFGWLKHFFFPPSGSPYWQRVLPFAVLGVATIFALTGAVYGWNYTNSPEFCGSACHTMPPEYSAYQRSPHARVQCVECHIGRDIVTTQITRKAGDLRHVTRTITENYEFPIRAKEMRPARDSCEKCHFPEKFSDDSLRQVRHFETDEQNTPETIYLIVKTGGGSKREGLGRGIHWHIENEVRFLATDPLEQEIPYVRVVNDDGSVVEYYDIASGFTPADVAGKTLKTMDCINCHNRVTHTIPDPGVALDLAMEKGLISVSLPYVRQRAEALLLGDYPDLETAVAAFDSLEGYYSREYPAVYAQSRAEIDEAIAAIREIYGQIVFKEHKLDWDTHPDNLGHVDDPGCFRCHDGKHMTQTGEAVRLECNLCHSVPIVAEREALVTNIEIVRGPEPTSHTHTSWITLHGRAIDNSCAACHQPASPDVDYTSLEGKPPADGSFCGNVACHANEWQYTGFDSPALEPILERQLDELLNTSPYLLEGVARTFEGTFGTMFAGRCVFCHAGPEAKAGLDLNSYEALLAGGTGGAAVVPGEPEASLLVRRQSGPVDHFGQFLDEELEAVRAWIEAGAPER